MRIALAGNPNSGKTTMFNVLTGRNEKVGNWAGVTVDTKMAPIKRSYYDGEEELMAVDLPGAYSISPFTSEESVTSDYVKNENLDIIINIVDATNLSRSLFFTTQLLELGIPVVVALNKSDINEKKKTVINIDELSNKLGCPVVETISTSSGHTGLDEVIKTAVSLKGQVQKAPYQQKEANLTSKAQSEASDRNRFEFVNKLIKRVETRKNRTNERNYQDKIDAVLTNRWLGIPIFAVVIFLVFQISQAWVGPWIAEGYEFENGTFIPGLATLISLLGEFIGGLIEGTHPLIYALLVDGIIGGVSAVIGFLPLVMVMYFLMALLEDCGYMARVSVVLDPIFKKVGLSGKSVIPFVIGTGCAVPGVMACRTIRNERERRATAMLAPFMPCGAKLPIISLFAAAFFGKSKWVGTLMYFVGIVIIFFGALLINKITGYSAKKSYFIMELPEYKAPSLWRAVKSMCSRGWSFIVKAATVILLCNSLVYIMQTFSWNFATIEEGNESASILASIAGPFAYVLIPITGVYAWQLAAATITGFIAKENVVGTLAVCFGLSNLINTEELSMVEGAGTEVAIAFGITKSAALAYLMLNLFTPPCFAAIGAMNSEMKSAKWFWGGIGLQFAVGYTVSFLVYQIGTLITTGSVGAGFIQGLVTVLAVISVIVFLIIRANEKLKAEAFLKNKR